MTARIVALVCAEVRFQSSYGQPVDLDVARGETTVLHYGRSRSNSVARGIVGLERPVSGQIRLLGVDPWSATRKDLRELRRRTGTVFSTEGLVSTLTLRENVGATLTFQGVAAVEEARERAEAMLERLEIATFQGLRPDEITREVRYRAAAARALASEPELMILEDPLSALDDTGGQALVRTCQELCETVIVLDPRKEEALREVADHIVQDAFWGFQEDTEQMRIE